MTGASSGIGYELARQFAQNGFDLLIASDSEGINAAARDIESLGANVETVKRTWPLMRACTSFSPRFNPAAAR